MILTGFYKVRFLLALMVVLVTVLVLCVVLMSLQEKFVGVPREHLRTEVASLVATLVRGSLGSE